MGTEEIERFLVEQNADRDAWYVDMRGAAVSFGERQNLASLEESLQHCRQFFEEKKEEWVHALLFSGKGASSSLTFTVYGDMQLVRAQIERCKSLIIASNGRPSTDERDGERPRGAVDRLSDKVRLAHDVAVIGEDAYEALHAIRWTCRDSYVFNNEVLIFTNHSNMSLRFTLRCIAKGGFAKDIDVSIGPGSRQDIGKDQGWQNNWVRGEKFEIWSNGIRIWGSTFE